MKAKILDDGAVRLIIDDLVELEALQGMLMYGSMLVPNPVTRAVCSDMMRAMNGGTLNVAVALKHPAKDAARVRKYKELYAKYGIAPKEKAQAPAPEPEPERPKNTILGDKLSAALNIKPLDAVGSTGGVGKVSL